MKTLEEYHKKYPPRPGDTAEKFARYEAFCERDPSPRITDPDYTGEKWDQWYGRLAQHMEKHEA